MHNDLEFYGDNNNDNKLTAYWDEQWDDNEEVESDDEEIERDDEETTGQPSVEQASTHEGSPTEVCPFGKKDTDKIQKMVEMIGGYFKETVEVEEIIKTVEECYRECSEEYGEKDAVEWAGGFEWPENAGTIDSNDLSRYNDNLVDLIRARQDKLAGERLSEARIKATTTKDDPDWETLQDIAPGMGIFTATEGPNKFEPCNQPPPMRAKYCRVHPAFNRMIWDLHEQGLVLLLPTERIKGREGVHFIPAHWAKKFRKKKGRNIIDPSRGFGMKGSQALNSKEGREYMKNRWGAIEHPTIIDLVLMVLDMIDRYGQENIVLWKSDLANAFGLLFVRAEQAPLLAVELTGGLTAIHICATFGFNGTPYAFAVVTRVLERASQKLIEGRVKMYVDDGMGCSHKLHLSRDMNTFAKVCEDLLGPKAMAYDKSESGRRMTFIGWLIDLDEGTISLAPHNFNKTLYGFFSVDLDKEFVDKKLLEKLASYASRYSMVARQMRPFVHSLHVCKNSSGGIRGAVRLTEEARLDILMWRVFLMLLRLRPSSYCRRLSSFRIRDLRVIFCYDSSLTGCGLVIYLPGRCRPEEAVRVLSLITPFDLKGDSGFQNSMEFLAVAIGFLVLVTMGWRDVPVMIIGDSVASETWCIKENFRSTVSRRASLLYMLIGVRFNIWVQEVQFIEGVRNVIPDRLSRRDSGQTAEALVMDLGFDEKRVWKPDERTEGLISMCNPTIPLRRESDLQDFWMVVSEYLDEL